MSEKTINEIKQEMRDLKHRIAQNQREITTIDEENLALFEQLAELGKQLKS